jgi:hypothetical protein
MTYAVIGSTDVYSWATAAREKALTSGGTSFGLNGVVKIKSLKQAWQTTDRTSAANKLNNDAAKPDVVLYFAHGADPTPELTNALINYIDRGGCVVYGSADGTAAQVNILMNGIFGMNTAQAQINGDDDVYQIANLPDNPIINGPFGNLCGRYWGEDNGSTGSVIITALPPNSVQICSASNQ